MPDNNAMDRSGLGRRVGLSKLLVIYDDWPARSSWSLSHSKAPLLIRYFHGHRQSYGTPQLSDDWGGFDYYIEIEDQHATRQINVFENGEILRYTRDHWCDEYGMMFIGKYSLKQKAGRGCRMVTENEFGELWRRSLESPNWVYQQRTAKMEQWGSWAERVGVDAV